MEGLTTDLLLCALLIGAVSFWIARRELPLGPAAAVVFVKIALPTWYFASPWSDRWRLLDDLTYWHNGQRLLAQGYQPFTIFFDAAGRTLMFALAGGAHIFYVWWSFLAQYLFGPHYYAPVFLNIAATFVAGVMLCRTIRHAGLSQRYAQGVMVFFLLHWEVLAWSSLINVKDTLVLALSASAFFYVVRFSRPTPGSSRIADLTRFVLILLILPWLRFYIPVLMLASIGLWMLLQTTSWRAWLIAGASMCAALLVVSSYNVPTELLELNPVSVAFGVVRFLLTPQPWSVDRQYSFLVLPALLHWLFLPLAVAGGVLLARASRVGLLFVLYLLVVVGFYAIVPDIQGPRQRLQLTFAISWLQFQGTYWLLAMVSPRLYVPLPRWKRDATVSALRHGGAT